jgi:apolipoprotein N-acyltransferase
MPVFHLGISLRDGLFALGAGLLGALAFAPAGIWPFLLLSISLILVLLRDQGTADARNLGLLYGLAYGLGTMHWLFGIFGLMALPLTVLMAGYFALWANLVGLTQGRPPLARAALAALFAVALEWLRGDAWYLRLPWYSPPHALAAAPAWVALARWLGCYGLSYLIWLIAAWGAFGRFLPWLAFLLLPLGSFLLPPYQTPDRKALLVQAEGTEQLEPLIAAIPPEKVDLAVLPEYAYATSPQRALQSPSGPGALARKVSSPVVFGAVEGIYGKPDFENVAAVIDSEGRLLGTFPKQRPVPLIRDGVPGTRRPVFPLDQGTLGVAVCFDYDAPAVAGALTRDGATVLVVPNMDVLSWGHTQHVHHELLLRLRAVENDRWVLRAASSGRSEAIDPHGRPSAEGVEIGVPGYVTVAYGHRDDVTPGSQAAFLGPLAAALAVVFLAAEALRFGLRRFPSKLVSPRRTRLG